MKPEFRYNGEYQSQKKQHKQECIEYILNKNYGDTISNGTLAEILKYNTDNKEEYKKFKLMMCIIKNILIDYGYLIKCIAGIGYYIMKPKQVSGYCYRTYILKTERLLEKNDRILTHVDQTELNDIRKEEYNNVKILNQDVYAAIDTAITDSEYYEKRNYYDSLED